MKILTPEEWLAHVDALGETQLEWHESVNQAACALARTGDVELFIDDEGQPGIRLTPKGTARAAAAERLQRQ